MTTASSSITGREHGVGIFVSLVSRGSQADIVGLKVLFHPDVPSKSKLNFIIYTSVFKLCSGVY